MRENKILWYVVCAILCWALYAATFDTRGNFDPVAQSDVIEHRIGWRLGTVASDANRSIEEQNRGAQRVVDGRARRVHKRVDEHETKKR